MSCNHDSRDLAHDCRTDHHRAAAGEFLGARPERLHAFSGAPASVSFARPVADERRLVERALRHAERLDATYRPAAGISLVPDPEVQHTSSGRRVVHLHQQFRGVPVFEGKRTVVFDHQGRLRKITGDTVAVPPDLSTVPELRAGAAAAEACRYVARSGRPGGRRYAPARVVASFPLPSRPTVLHKRGYGAGMSAHLVLFPRGRDVQLGWRVLLAKHGRRVHDVVVGARGPQGGEVLYAKRAFDRALGRGEVYLENPDAQGRRMVPFPRPLADHPLAPPADLPVGFPPDWIAADRTLGNNAAAFRGNTSRTLRGRVMGDGRVTFEPLASSADQRLLNAFYFCNYLHDFFYLLGFDERAGNFQHVNFRQPTGSGGPGDEDELQIRIFRGELDDGAAISSVQDGQKAEMEIGIFPDSPNHGALDADIVIHEFVHGVTSRVVGGRDSILPLRKPQSHALAEGYSDYFAVTLQEFGKAQPKTLLGVWASGRPGGVRRAPYDDGFPGHFQLLGSPAYREPHDAGEIWAATLISMNRRLGQALGSADEGHRLGWQIVFDSLKELPFDSSSPSFLDARDAIGDALGALHARGRLDDAAHAAAAGALAAAFLRFGMGPAASCANASFEAIQGDPRDPLAVPQPPATGGSP